MASTEVRTENNRTQIPAGDDVDRTTQDLNHLDLNNHNGSVFFVFFGNFHRVKICSDRAKASASASAKMFFDVCCLFFVIF